MCKYDGMEQDETERNDSERDETKRGETEWNEQSKDIVAHQHGLLISRMSHGSC